jgi:hypothetical protein
MSYRVGCDDLRRIFFDIAVCIDFEDRQAKRNVDAKTMMINAGRFFI